MSQTDDFFEELRRVYLAEAPTRLAELEKDLAALAASEAGAGQSLKTRFHRLAGSGGSYGFPSISQISRAAERWIATNPEPGAAGIDHLRTSIAELAQAFDQAAAEVGLPTTQRAAFGWRSVILGGDGPMSDGAAAALTDSRYSVERHPPSTDASAVPVSRRFDLAVIAAGLDRGTTALVEHWAGPSPARPDAVVLIAPPERVDPVAPPFAHLDAVIDPGRIERELGRFARTLGRSRTAPRTVLLAHPDEPTRLALRGMLESAGVRTILCADLGELRRAVESGPADLILMEWRLPGTTGAAVIRWIRGMTPHRLTPIVVHAARMTDDDRLLAMRAGADEVLLGHVETTLGPILLARIERGIAVRALAHRDDLTGLLNHFAMIDETEHAVAYGRRNREGVGFLSIDLDHFRRVNEEYGYAVGDGALIHLARVLASLVRASDFIGRMGGEEFGILVRRSSREGASILAERLRTAVIGSPVVLAALSIPVRVSIGIAVYPEDGGSGDELRRAADRALAAAKSSGRNRVEGGIALHPPAASADS